MIKELCPGVGWSFEFVTAVLTDTQHLKVLGLHRTLQTQQGVNVGSVED